MVTGFRTYSEWRRIGTKEVKGILGKVEESKKEDMKETLFLLDARYFFFSVILRYSSTCNRILSSCVIRMAVDVFSRVDCLYGMVVCKVAAVQKFA